MNAEIIERIQRSFLLDEAEFSMGFSEKALRKEIALLSELATERKGRIVAMTGMLDMVARMVLRALSMLDPVKRRTAPEIEVWESVAKGVTEGKAEAIATALEVFKVSDVLSVKSAGVGTATDEGAFDLGAGGRTLAGIAPGSGRAARDGSSPPSQERVRELFNYEPSTGELTWKRSSGRAKAGDPAGNISTNPNGKEYRQVNFDRRTHYAQEIAWLHETGSWPAKLGFRDGNTLNVRFDNLREETAASLQHSSALAPRHSTTGARGVSRRGDKFVVHIKVDGEKRYLGSFDTLESAQERYLREQAKVRADARSVKKKTR